MKKMITLFLLLSAIFPYAQELRFTDILNEEKLIDKNVIEKFIDNDFSGLWLKSEHVRGIIGDDCQRIRVKMLSIVKNENNPEEYLVYGKTMVRTNIGAGGFSPDKTYTNVGWENYIKMLSGDKQA